MHVCEKLEVEAFFAQCVIVMVRARVWVVGSYFGKDKKDSYSTKNFGIRVFSSTSLLGL